MRNIELPLNIITASNGALKLQYRNDKQSWDEFVTKINHSLDNFELEFRALHDEITGKEMYALVSPLAYMTFVAVKVLHNSR